MGEMGRAGIEQDLRTLWEGGAAASAGDAVLLARFLRRDAAAEAAFAALVARHGPMVLRVCRDVLGDPDDAQDSAQATFLVLARRAATIRDPEALPGWLHGTARRLAARALRDAIVRRRHELRSLERSGRPRPETAVGEEPRTWPELHEELDRLPDRYRAAIVLCDLSGLSHEEAAGRIGCPPRTLQTRLYRGRARLKDRLIRRGVAPAAILAALARTGRSLAAVPPPAWVGMTAHLAVRLASKAGWGAAGAVPGLPVLMARSYLKEMAMRKIVSIVAGCLIAAIAAGAAWSRGFAARTGEAAAGSIAAVPEGQDLPADTRPITVTGRAVDPDGEPVADARVTLASLAARHGKVAETRTDARGRYAFRDALLPIEPAKSDRDRDLGRFQVFATAGGLGTAWRPTKVYFPKPRTPAPPPAQDTFDPPSRYEAGDRIELDLRFTQAGRLAGTVVDEAGRPIAGVRLEIYDCAALEVIDNCVDCWTLNMLNGAVPDSLRVRTSDALGKFDFSEMPADCRFRIILKAANYPWRTIYAATSAKPQPIFDGSPVLAGEIRVTMPTSLAVPVRVVLGDSGKPAARAFVQAGGSIGTTDAEGRVTLHLPPGHHEMQNWPAIGTPYLVSGGGLDVGASPPAVPADARLEPAAFVEISVVDEATGRGVAGVDFWREEGANVEDRSGIVGRKPVIVRSWEAETRIVHRDPVRTDAEGRARFPIESGRHRIGAGKDYLPADRVIVDPAGQVVECRAGETATARFVARKRP